jgi:dTDP-4-dehydrorhamnose reductase
MRILVTGSAGLLGSEVVAEAARRGHDLVATTHATLDVTDDSSRDAIVESAPDVVVHCAAYTAVDQAEADAERAMAVNRDGTRRVAAGARAAGALLVFPSSDYVFDGRADRPYRVSDPPAPRGVYALSKLAGEEAARSAGGRHLVMRTSWLYGAGGRNFVDTIRRLGQERDEIRVVCDQRGRPTWSRSLAATLLDLVDADASGTVHASDSGSATWDELARATLELAGSSARVVPVSTDTYGAAAPRPAYSVLDLDETEALLGHPLPHWRTSLAAYLGGSR